MLTPLVSDVTVSGVEIARTSDDAERLRRSTLEIGDLAIDLIQRARPSGPDGTIVQFVDLADGTTPQGILRSSLNPEFERRPLGVFESHNPDDPGT